MNEKEKFEDIIESKFAEAEFPFDEANWDAAEEMISSFRKKQKRRRVGFIFLSGIVLGVIAMLPFVIKKNYTSTNVIAEVTKTAIGNKDNNIATPLETEAFSENKTNTPDKTLPVNINETGDLITKNSVNVVATENNINNNSTDVLANIDARLNNKPMPKPVVEALTVRTNRRAKKQKNKHPEKIKADKTLAAIAENVETNNKQIEELDSEKQSPILLVKLNNDLTLEKDSMLVITQLGVPEKLADVANKKSLPCNLSIAIGGNYVNNFSFNPIQGIEISKPLNTHLEIGTGLYYTYLTIHSGAVKSITTHTNYDFGYQKDITEIKTNKLHYALVPVFVKYNVNDKNTFVMGANMFALFTSSNSVTTYKESYGEKQGVASKKTAGYSNGINKYDVGLLLGYKRQLFGNLGAAVYFNYGLMDIKKNDYYNENKFERNISGQFMLTFKL